MLDWGVPRPAMAVEHRTMTSSESNENMNRIKKLGPLACLALCSTAALAAEDLPGSSDHPQFPRIEGTEIVGYAYSGYGEGQFHSSMEDSSLNLILAEGPHTRLIYLTPQSVSPLGALRNYQSIFQSLGEVSEHFSCRGRECYRNLGGAFVWAADRRIPYSLGESKYLYSQPKYYRDQIYWYGTVTGSDSQYTVSVYAATRSGEDDFLGSRGFEAGQSLVHLEIVENQAFEPTLEIVEAAEIADTISADGHIALYGIYFDTDSDVVLPGSASALTQIAKALQDDPELNIYVVGHTDNTGEVEANLDLSMRRARSVVASLVTEHGIAEDRMVPLGAGLAAPVATNDTDEGRARNRRVELVKR